MKREYIEAQTLEKLDFSGQAVEHKEYESCFFQGCDFSHAALTGSRFIETEFVDCNLSNADLTQASFQDVRFRACKMLGLHFDLCNDFGFSVTFEQCLLDDSLFAKMKLAQTSFFECQLKSVDFSEADMKGVPIRKCDLQHAVFEYTRLEKADFSQSFNYSIDPRINPLRGATFSLPEVVGLLDAFGIKVG